MIDIDSMSGQDIIEEFCTQNNIRRSFEGDTGVENLETLLSGMGYEEQQFRNGDPLHQFLADNPGCIEAMLEWVAEQMDGNDPGGWKENLLENGMREVIEEDNNQELKEMLQGAGADYAKDNPDLSDQDLQGSCGDLADGVLAEAELEGGVIMEREVASDLVYEGMVQARKEKGQ